ncbi:MAG: winged helix-turn-helix domain-containing protein [Bdellovibrionales bacterium]|nr:winged helix-turn-helix domain-containing protein [Bdellovibrionales bacterium]
MSERTNNQNDLLFEVARLHAARCDFPVAIEKAEAAAQLFLKERDFDRFLKCQNLLLRVSAEMENFERVNNLKEELQDLVLKESLELNSKTYYTLGICSRLKGNNEAALDYFQKAVALALESDNKEDLCYAITGIAIVYNGLNRLSDALREIYNLQVFFEVLDVPDIKLSTQILNGFILQKLERYDQALDSLTGCYELLRKEKNLYMYLHLLFALGCTYAGMGETEMARLHFMMAKQSTDSQSLVKLSREIDEKIASLGGSAQKDYDLVFDSKSNSVMERKRGKIDFKNQFILLDLLHMFLRSPGQVFTKETITAKVWDENYDPIVHDNKIYVTIKRLRKLIEPDVEKPKYIFRAKNGYFLNKAARILIQG